MSWQSMVAVSAMSLVVLGCSGTESEDALKLKTGDRLSLDFSVALGDQSYNPQATSTIDVVIGEEIAVPVADPYRLTLQPTLHPEDPATVLLRVRPTGVRLTNEWTPHLERRESSLHETSEFRSKDFSFFVTVHWPQR